jgi:cytochrome bd-type quinol oxidase subunit 1
MKKTNYFLRLILCLVLATLPVIGTVYAPVAYAFAATPTPVPPTQEDVQEALDQLQSGGDGSFDEVGRAITGAVSSIYTILRNVGLMVIILCGVAAAILFGILKNEQSIQKNKTWLLRIIVAVALVALIPTILGMVAGLGDKLGR